jgi:hypothetical protein
MGKLISKIAALIALSSSSCLAVVTEANVVVVNGSVSCKRPVAAEAVRVTKGDTVTVGSTIQTEVKSDLLMSPLPGSAVRVLENNSLVLTETDLQKKGETVLGRTAKLQLNRGTVQVGLDKIGGTADFKITTPQCVAAARGTVFSTTVIKGATTTIVLNGIVAVPWTDRKGKAHTTDVNPKMKVTIKEGANGLEQEGPLPATRAELAALEAFTKFATGLGLLRFAPVGAIPAVLGPAGLAAAPLGAAPLAPIPLAPIPPLVSP